MASSAITGPILSDVRRSPSGSAAAPSWSFADATGTGVYLASTDVLALSTAGVQRVVVTAAGNVGIGTDSPVTITQIRGNAASTNGALAVDNDNTADANPGLRVRTAAEGTTSANKIVNFVRGVNAQGAIVCNGAGVAAFGSFSDIRLKKNIKPLESELQKILALNPVSFDWADGSGEQVGFIAQQLEQQYPDVVSYVGPDTEEMKTVAGWDKTTARLVKAIQELKAELDEAKAKIAALESKP